MCEIFLHGPIPSATRDDLRSRAQKSKCAGLGQENGFAAAYLHTLLRLIKV
jgi:hypothetical protein